MLDTHSPDERIAQCDGFVDGGMMTRHSLWCLFCAIFYIFICLVFVFVSVSYLYLCGGFVEGEMMTRHSLQSQICLCSAPAKTRHTDAMFGKKLRQFRKYLKQNPLWRGEWVSSKLDFYSQTTRFICKRFSPNIQCQNYCSAPNINFSL